MQRISPIVDSALEQVARKTGDLYSVDALNALLDDTPAQKPRKSKKFLDNLAKLKEDLGPGLWTNITELKLEIEKHLNRNNQASTIHSPLVLTYKEFGCCKHMKFHHGNIITGRDKEISEIMLTLCRGNKRGVILVGEPGVGKTAIVREINNRLIQRTVPRSLIGCEILNMDLPYIFSVYKTDPIGAITAVLERASEYDKAILFIDEVHQLMGHRMNDLMKPYLTEKIRFIGSTTIDEYHTIINEDRALERRFTVIPIEEPGIEKTIEMVEGTKSIFEDHHKCTIPSDVVQYAVTNGSRFLGQRRNPDKSLDIVDIACSILSEKEIKEVKKRFERSGDPLKDVALLQKEFENISLTSGNRNLTKGYIDQAISSVTGINYGDIQNSLNYDDVYRRLTEQTIGQDKPLENLANVVNIFKNIKPDRTRPVSILLVVGPPGTGKKSSCRNLAKYLFGSERYFIDYDMSGFTSEFTLTELKGAPPGYVGYGRSGRLIKEIKNHPQSVVYFGKLNKAHEKVQQYILDACRAGKMTDSADREAKLNNTIIVFSVTLDETETDNIFKGKLKSMGFGKSESQTSETTVIRKIVGEEIINNVDEIALFHKLTKDDLEKVFEMNKGEFTEMYNVDIDEQQLKDRVMENSSNGHDVLSKLSSVVPHMVFSKLRKGN